MSLYKTVRSEAEASQIIEKSKFIAHVKPVESKEEADAFIREIKSRYKDATHNVPAMVVGDKFQIQWASDDGEPQGTSGAPIVQMLVKEELTNLALVVTRYFGGIKLGTGGLVRAYTGSAKLGVEAAGICSVEEICRMTVELDYSHLAKLQSMASERLSMDKNERASGAGKFVIADTRYTEKVTLEILNLPEDKNEVKSIFSNVTSGNAEFLTEETILEKI